MATTVEMPHDQIRTKGHQQILNVWRALQCLRSGGTATDVREALADSTGEVVHVRTVRRILWLLSELGHVAYREDSQSRWWTLANACPSSRIDSTRNS